MTGQCFASDGGIEEGKEVGYVVSGRGLTKGEGSGVMSCDSDNGESASCQDLFAMALVRGEDWHRKDQGVYGAGSLVWTK